MIIFSHTNHYDGLSDDSAVRLVLSQTVEPEKEGPIYRMFQRMGLDFDLPATLRMHPSFTYSLGTDEEFGRFPVMVLPYQDGRGVFVGLELCFMSPDGRFAPVVEPRMQYWLNEAVPGAFHAIAPPPRASTAWRSDTPMPWPRTTSPERPCAQWIPQTI